MNDFLETLTVEAYGETPEYTEEEYKQAEIDILKIENEQWKDIESNSMGINMANTITNATNEVEETMTKESFIKLETTMQNIAMLNGFEKNVFLMEDGVLTSEADDKGESMLGKAKSMAGKVAGKAKEMIAKFKAFVSKWIAKAIILVSKGDDKRKALADKIEALGTDIDKVELPATIISKLVSKVSSKDTTVANAKAFLTFNKKLRVKDVDTDLYDISKVKTTDNTYANLGRGVASVLGKSEKGNLVANVVYLKEDVLKKYKNAKTVGDMDLDIDAIKDLLKTSKKDFSSSVDTILSTAKLSEEESASDSAARINDSTRNVFAALNEVRDSITVAKIITKDKKKEKKEKEETK